MEPKALGGVTSLERPDWIGGHRGSRWDIGQRAPVRSGEPQRGVRRPGDVVAVLVHRTVMAPAEQDEIREGRRPSLGPVMHVMPLSDPDLAAREATGPIAMAQSPA